MEKTLSIADIMQIYRHLEKRVTRLEQLILHNNQQPAVVAAVATPTINSQAVESNSTTDSVAEPVEIAAAEAATSEIPVAELVSESGTPTAIEAPAVHTAAPATAVATTALTIDVPCGELTAQRSLLSVMATRQTLGSSTAIGSAPHEWSAGQRWSVLAAAYPFDPGGRMRIFDPGGKDNPLPKSPSTVDRLHSLRKSVACCRRDDITGQLALLPKPS